MSDQNMARSLVDAFVHGQSFSTGRARSRQELMSMNAVSKANVINNASTALRTAI